MAFSFYVFVFKFLLKFFDLGLIARNDSLSEMHSGPSVSQFLLAFIEQFFAGLPFLVKSYSEFVFVMV